MIFKHFCHVQRACTLSVMLGVCQISNNIEELANDDDNNDGLRE